MRVSSKTDYALRTVLDLALHRGEGVMRVADIAKRQEIPAKFLEHVLLALKGAGIVASRRGMKGGYFLAMPPSGITIASIVRLTEDSLFSHDRRGRNRGVAVRTNHAWVFREVWAEIDEYLTVKLEGVTILDMCTRAMEASRTANSYSI